MGIPFSLLLVTLKGRVPFSDLYEIYCRLLPVTWRLMSGLCDSAAEPSKQFKMEYWLLLFFKINSYALNFGLLHSHLFSHLLPQTSFSLFILFHLLPQFLLCSQTPPPPSPLPQTFLTYCTEQFNSLFFTPGPSCIILRDIFLWQQANQDVINERSFSLKSILSLSFLNQHLFLPFSTPCMIIGDCRFEHEGTRRKESL